MRKYHSFIFKFGNLIIDTDLLICRGKGSIRYGSSHMDKGGNLVKVVDYRIHPKYFNNDTTVSADVAVLKLREPMKLSSTAQAIKFASSPPKPDDLLMVSGWGAIAYEGNLPEKLLAVNVRSVALEECKKPYAEKGYQVFEGMICAADAGKDACQGDSGGPLVNEKKELVGVVSFGWECAVPGLPGIYADVDFYKKFIEKAIREM